MIFLPRASTLVFLFKFRLFPKDLLERIFKSETKIPREHSPKHDKKIDSFNNENDDKNNVSFWFKFCGVVPE